jgi:hypothetical protein
LLASSATHAAALGCGIRGRSAPRRPGMRPPVVELHPVGLGSGCAVGGAPPLQPRRTQGPLPACRLPRPESSCSDGEVRRPRAQHAPHKWLCVWGGDGARSHSLPRGAAALSPGHAAGDLQCLAVAPPRSPCTHTCRIEGERSFNGAEELNG